MATGYIFRRKGSSMWWIKLRHGGKRIEKSLGESDFRKAEAKALKGFEHNGEVISIATHKAALLAARPHVETTWEREYEPGLHTGLEGERIFATATEVHYLDENPIRTVPNGKDVRRLVTHGATFNSPTWRTLPAAQEFKLLDDDGAAPERPKLVTRTADADEQLFEGYLVHAGVTGYREKEARAMWAIFRSVVNKPLRECTRDDGRAIVAHMIDQAKTDDPDELPKSATLRRRLVPLVAAVNYGIEEGKKYGLTFNPFHGVVGKQGAASDARKRFTDEDMVAIRANLHKLDPNLQTLVRTLATTGVRRGEAFQIADEQMEDGIRYCVVGTKTDASLRRVPFPKDLLPYLPEKITGRLITGREDTASKKLREWLTDDCGITDPDKAPMHSFRHRAKRRLENAKPALSRTLINAVGGWASTEKKTSGDKYGKDSEDNAVLDIADVKDAIDRIGF